MARGRVLGASLAAVAAAIAAATVGVSQASSANQVKLTIWSYDGQFPGPGSVLKQATALFEKQNPNITVDLIFKDFNSIVQTVPRAVQSGSGPDVFEGGQGWVADGQLVKSKGVLNLEPYLKKWGWQKWYSPSTWQQFRWTPDAKVYGKGPAWGVAMNGQNVVLFYNKAKLRQVGLGTTPASFPKTFTAFSAMLEKIRAKLPQDEPVFQVGMTGGGEPEFLWSAIAGQYVNPAQVRGWVYHNSGRHDFGKLGFTQAFTTLQQWAKAGYFNKDFLGLSEQEAATKFAKGNGVFLLEGNWDAGIVKQGLGKNAGVTTMPGKLPGHPVADGLLSGTWHNSSKTKNPDAAAKWVQFLMASPASIKLWYKYQNVPAIQHAPPPPKSDVFLNDLVKAWTSMANSGGLLTFVDMATPDGNQVMDAGTQELLGGKLSADGLAKQIQASWDRFDKTLH